jgi:WhiB family redox-sensing transcriptional regulator
MPEQTTTGRDYPLRGDSTWMAKAACRDEPTELFFRTGTRKIREALAICSGCPVRARCLDTALPVEEPGMRYGAGIRGGLTWAERQRLLVAFAVRFDPDRVAAALGGADIHLSPPEQAAVTEHLLAADDMGLSELGWRLGLTRDQVKKLRAGRGDPDEPVPAPADFDDEAFGEPDESELCAIEEEQENAANHDAAILNFPHHTRTAATPAAA